MIDQMNDKDKEKQLQKEADEQQCKYFELFRFATGYDKCVMLLGSIAAFINGASFPLFSLVFGEMIDAFGASYSPQKVVDNALIQFYWFLGIGALSFILSWIQMQTFIISGESQAIRCRKEYFQALLRQDISWFDQGNPNELATKVATETFALGGAIGEKLPTFIMTISMVFFGFAVAFMRGWELSLICTAALPFLSLSAGFFTYVLQNQEQMLSNSYKLAGGVAEQAIGSIKTVKSLNGQDYEQNKYQKSLVYAYKLAIKSGLVVGFGLGLMWFVMLADYGVGFWFGSLFVGDKTNNALYDRPYTGGDVIVIFFSIMTAGFSLGQAAPCLKNFALGKQAGYNIFKVIDAKPIISPSLEKGEKKQIFGNIILQNVDFTYPNKPDVQILKSINLEFKAGQKTALVGESGSGKSTIMQLVQRFYDPNNGNVILDGLNIKDYNLQWIRDNVGYVGQEPALFATSIRENLKFGKSDATEEQMIQALKDSNAYDFVMNLDDKLDTFVGSSGSQLSGGQKQRLSIARAILKNPTILLLDEATSALDRKNEKEIQATLDELSKDRTTIVIAHRLTTVQNADEIIVMDQGQLVEQGTHQSLLQQKGKYAALCENQIAADDDNEENQDIQNQKIRDQENKSSSGQSDRQVKKTQSLKKNQIGVAPVDSQQVGIDEKQEKELTQEEKKELAKKEKQEQDMIMTKLYKFNHEEKPWMFIGGIGSLISGSSFPFISLIMAQMMDILGKVEVMDKDEFRDESDKWCIWFLYIALITFVFTIIQYAAWNKVAQALTLKLRKVSFQKLLDMETSFYDESENNAGALSARLGSDTQLVNGLTSSVINLQIANYSSFLSGVTIAFVFDWRTALVACVGFPLIVIAGAVQAQFVAGFSETTDSGYKDSGNLVQESVCNIRTVLSFGNEKAITDSFAKRLEIPFQTIKPKALQAGIAFGFSQFVMFLVYGCLFYIGAIFHRDAGVEAVDMFTAIFAVMYAGFGAGNNAQFMTDVGAAFNAARNLFKIIDASDEINKDNELYPNQISEGNIEGNIQFINVSFTYPSRDKKVLDNISFNIYAGQKVAFVGPSGCGKSTIMQLVMRFYEIQSGQILLDGKDIHDYNLQFLRSQFGVVSQEPVLFSGTIEENIIYNTQNVTHENMLQASQQAQAREFIEKDDFDNNNVKENEQLLDGEGKPLQIGKGFKRQVGTKGSQLSGGQKQRIAIARAIIKKPKILLLDEATSALDSKNEEIVQQSLDSIMQGKTTLAVAHRISTIRDSDNIIVIEDGKMVEEGNYQTLQDIKGFFYRLERGQQN